MRFVHILFLLFLLNVSQLFAHRENSYYLYGTFGNQKVAIQIDEYGNDCMARYFTADNLYDHVLEGKILPDTTFEFHANEYDPVTKEKAPGSRLTVKEIRLDVWQGVWEKPDGTAQEVHLNRIEVNELDHPFIKAIQKYKVSPFAAYRTKNIKLVDLKKEKISKGAYIMNEMEPETGMKWFRLIQNSKYLPDVDSVNIKLQAEFLMALNYKYSCVYMGKPGDYQYEFEVQYLSKDLISYKVISNAACYGSPTQNLVVYNTLYMKDAETVSLENLFWFGEKPQPELKDGEYAWFQYRYKVFGPQILEFMNAQYPDKMSPQSAGACNYHDVKVWQFPTWCLTKKGLYLGSKSPITSRKCDDAGWSVIPYKKLKPYVSTDMGLVKK
ncbi:hypothetical protein ACE01N_05125 [Saccharicrinis sp. FJH2]|uniref:hypothetical protein n=1 Tax=Saccharicrinis sp. FJH65 TaxID=3344659 RepID=UPI0035F4E719